MRLLLVFVFIIGTYLGKSQNTGFQDLSLQSQEMLKGLNTYVMSGAKYPVDSINIPLDSITSFPFGIENDSVYDYDLIEYYRYYAEELLLQLFNHPDIMNYDFDELGLDEEIAISKDGKLQMLNYYENHGGTYRGKRAFIQYRPGDGSFINLLDDNNEGPELSEGVTGFYSDGYTSIYQLETLAGTKYLIEGNVRGCSYCFSKYIQLLSYRNNQFYLEFEYHTESRDWGETIWVSEDLKTIEVFYQTDDLTPECNCKTLEDGAMSRYDNPIDCKCIFEFNGVTYVKKE
jgi:hypothetical protein